MLNTLRQIEGVEDVRLADRGVVFTAKGQTFTMQVQQHSGRILVWAWPLANFGLSEHSDLPDALTALSNFIAS